MKESHTKEHWRRLSVKRLRRLPEAAADRWVLLGNRNARTGKAEFQLVFVHRTLGGFCAHGFTHCLIPTVPWEIKRQPRK